MSTSTIEPGTIDVVETVPLLRPQDPGDHDTFAHYVRRDQVADATIFGLALTALCGKKWVPAKDPAAFPVCPTCKEVLYGMPPGEPDDRADAGLGE